MSVEKKPPLLLDPLLLLTSSRAAAPPPYFHVTQFKKCLLSLLVVQGVVYVSP